MSTLKVEVVAIDHIEPHPNADRLDLATVKGWQCVTTKGMYQKGNLCVYFPIDSILPQDVEEAIFPPDSKVILSKHRVKTIKLRGAVSQGLIVNLETLKPFLSQDISTLKKGTDLTLQLGVLKYEPIVNSGPQKGCLTASKKQQNPNFRKYTSIENFKNYNQLFKEDEHVFITEKIHGTNFRAGYVKTHVNTWWKKLKRFFGMLPEWEFVYGSHNVQLQDKPGRTVYYAKDVYGEAVKLYDLKNVIPKGYVIYGEIYGDGIQKGYTYNCGPGARRLVVFDVMDSRTNEYLSPVECFNFCKQWDLDHVPLLFRGPFNEAHAKLLSQGDSVLAPAQKVREGVVIKPLKDEKCYIGRKVLKLINDDYLLRDDNTDFH